MCVYVCLFVVCLVVRVRVFRCLFACICFCVWLFVRLFACLWLWVSVSFVFVCLCVCSFARLFDCLFVVYLSVCVRLRVWMCFGCCRVCLVAWSGISPGVGAVGLMVGGSSGGCARQFRYCCALDTKWNIRRIQWWFKGRWYRHKIRVRNCTESYHFILSSLSFTMSELSLTLS